MKPAGKISRIRATGLLLGVALLSLPYTSAVAADTKSKQERAAQFRLQQMQQKFEQDKAALEQESAALKEQLKKGEAELTAARKALARQRQELSKLQEEISGKDTQLVSCHREAESARLAARNELVATQQKLKQGEALNKQLDGEKSRLEISLAEQKSEAHACQAKNASLIDMFKEMASKYEKAELKGVEQFTGLKGVEIENRFQDKRDLAEAQLYRPRK